MLFRYLDFGQYTLNALAIPTVITALAVFTLGIFAVSRERGSRVSAAFLLVTVTISVWLFAYSGMYCATSEQIALWWAKSAYIGVALIPAALYHYSVLVLREDRKYGKRALYIWMIGFFFLLLILTTNMLFSSLYRYWWGFFPAYRITSIPFLLYYFVVTMDVVRRFWTASRATAKGPALKMRARSALVTLTVGSLAFIDFFADWGVPIYPFGYIFILFFIALAARGIVRYELVTITPAIAAPQIIATMNDLLIVLDREGVIRLVNQATCGLFGYREQELLGKQLRSINGISFAHELDSIILGPEVRNFSIDYRPEANTAYTLSVSTSIMRYPSGAPLAFVCVLRDISERKQAEEEREKLIGELQKALAEIKTLHGFLPICYSCKKVRDDSGYWTQVEHYIEDHSEIEFSHGLCPDCAKKELEDIVEYQKNRKDREQNQE
jgi:PAS domain S-box-containing protein